MEFLKALYLAHYYFFIYVNNVASVSKVSKFDYFADDTSIYFDSNDPFTLQKVVNRELKKVKKW